MVSRYQKRVSGPLMDRIDIHVEVPAVKYEKLSDDRLGEPSAVVRARVEAARAIQRRRFEGTAMTCNADRHSLPLGWGRLRYASSAGWMRGAGT
jgi:magnesium chelatase family protein